ncbi:MAG: P-loop containing nucleoside triphosphate hydrolase protein [Monoraphidium minutum]|nr:MAG: P-loop containing nucleoside triphosphate hydrolase protein [Monoraphidium minutum]
MDDMTASDQAGAGAVANAATYERWFKAADADMDGRVTGADAVAFFRRSGLSRDVLARVWDMSNTSRTGYLDRAAFHKAMDLISIAQQGSEVTKATYLAALGKGIPMPTITGMMEPAPGASGPGSAADGGGASRASTPGEAKDAPAEGRRPAAAAGANPRQPKVPQRVVTSVVDGLKAIYLQKVRPLEEAFKFSSFFSSLLQGSDFDAKPSVLLIGQYSTGKTTFIKSILGRDYPGAHIGPEPTTDRFVVVHHGLEERRTPGNTLAVQSDKPFQGLSGFGTGFLKRFEGSQCPAKLLEEISIVDTPGVLSGEKQRIDRQYSFINVCEWFAARCDMILLLFDPFKLDISDEMRQVIHALRGHDDKIRVVLNKADQVDQQQLMRVYGALMWSLGKVFRTPEVCRVYIGSFNAGKPIDASRNPECVGLFEKEHAALLEDLHEIPARSCDRKVNEFVKRVRALKIHMLLMGAVRKAMPSVFGKGSAQRKILDELPEIFYEVQREHQLPAGDFPDLARFRSILATFDFTLFPKLTPDKLAAVDAVLSEYIPNLVKAFDNPYH